MLSADSVLFLSAESVLFLSAESVIFGECVCRVGPRCSAPCHGLQHFPVLAGFLLGSPGSCRHHAVIFTEMIIAFWRAAYAKFPKCILHFKKSLLQNFNSRKFFQKCIKNVCFVDFHSAFVRYGRALALVTTHTSQFSRVLARFFAGLNDPKRRRFMKKIKI